MRTRQSIALLISFLLLLGPSPLFGWQITSSYPLPMPGSNPAYWGFPSLMQAPIPGGSLRVTAVNGNSAPPANQCIADKSYAGTGLDIYTVRYENGASTAYNSSFSPGGVGKLLYQYGTQLFLNPTTGIRYDGAIFYATQRIPGCAAGLICGVDGKWIAYTNDGVSFVGHRRILADCAEEETGSETSDRRCYDSSWWCDQGWPCDSAYPRSWWTEGEMTPIYFNGAFYALALNYIYDTRAGQPLYSGPEIWTLSSTDGGNTWSRYLQVSSGSVDPPYFQPGCFPGPWMFNLDLALDAQAGVYYITRAYSDNYAGCGHNLPSRVQVYSAVGAPGLIYGPWTKIADLGCGELGLQPDSAWILHNGLGHVIPGGSSSITMEIGVSGAGWTHFNCFEQTSPAACSPPANRIQEVVLTP